MRTLMIWTAIVALALGAWGCNAQLTPGDGEENPDDPGIGNYESTGCKTLPANRQNAPEFTDGSEEESFVGGIEAIAGNNSVLLIHHNARYQCDTEIQFRLEANGAKLIVTEIPKTEVVTDCMCYMDLSVEILNLTPGTIYTIEVWDEFHDELFGSLRVKVGECPDECEMSSDCADLGLPHDDCEGNWACNEGLCEWICGGELPCTSDYDCPNGWECVWYAYPDDEGDGQEPPPDPGSRPDGYPGEPSDDAGGPNETVPDEDMLYYDCESDSDCPEGMWCEMMDCGWDDEGNAPGQSDCWPYGYCVGDVPPPPENGYCEPRPWECNTTDDCYYPSGEPGDPADPTMPSDCRVDCIQNQCVWECGPGECWDDADCPYGYYCGYMDYDTPDDPDHGDDPSPSGGQREDGSTDADAMPYYGGVCIPYEEYCYSDEDCPQGYRCEWMGWDDDGTPTPGDDDGSNHTDPDTGEAPEPYGGVCVPNQDYCYSDWDCPSGYHCEYGQWDGSDPPPPVDENGGGSTDSDPEGGVPNPDYGYCVPDGPMECRSDADCYEWFGEEDGYGQWACIDGLCYSINDCEYTCASDADCSYDNYCMRYEECDETGDCCSGTMCVPYEEPPCDSNNDCPAESVCMNGVCVDYPDCEAMDATGQCLCGGFAGFQCPDNQECIFDDPNCNPETGGADCMGHCYPPQTCACPEYYHPVCGSDGVTYDNECFAECAGARVVHEGSCDEYCYSSYDCAEGEVCTVDLGECMAPPECDDPDMDCPAVCVGVCIDYGAPCESNADCLPWQMCDSCPPYPGCPECDACGPPVCVDMPD